MCRTEANVSENMKDVTKAVFGANRTSCHSLSDFNYFRYRPISTLHDMHVPVPVPTNNNSNVRPSFSFNSTTNTAHKNFIVKHAVQSERREDENAKNNKQNLLRQQSKSETFRITRSEVRQELKEKWAAGRKHTAAQCLFTIFCSLRFEHRFLFLHSGCLAQACFILSPPVYIFPTLSVFAKQKLWNSKTVSFRREKVIGSVPG